MIEYDILLEKLKLNHRYLYILLGCPTNKDELLQNLYNVLKNNNDIDPLPFLMKLNNAGLTTREIHSLKREFSYFSFKTEPGKWAKIIEEYDRLLDKSNIHKLEGFNSATRLLMDRVNHMDSEDEIKELLDSCDFSVGSFGKLYRRSIFGVKGHDDEEEEEETVNYSVSDTFKEKTAFYSEKLRENLEKEEIDAEIDDLYDAYSMVVDYVSSGIEKIDDYCADRKISSKDFYYYLSLVKKHSPNDYQMYFDYINKSRNKRYASLLGYVESLAKKINEKVLLPNGVVREYDAVDYYMDRYDKIADNEGQILKIAKDSSSQVHKTLLTFFGKYFRDIGSTNVQKVAYDVSYKYMVNGAVKELTKEEKDYIISFLNRYNVPFNARTYSLAIKRYVSGEMSEYMKEDIDNKENTI